MNNKTLKEFILAAISIFLFTWLVFIATPFDIIASNPDEFTYVPGKIILSNALFYGLIGFLFLTLLYAVFFSVFRDYVRTFLLVLLVAIAISAWLNSTFLTGVYGEFDGRGNLQIEPFGALSWIQMTAFLAVFIFAYLLIKKGKVLSQLVLSILFIVLATSAINITTKLSEKKIEYAAEEDFFTYSKNNPNLLYIILDAYQTDFFAEILDDKIKKELRGFIWFKDTAANFPTTIAAVPTIFTGAVYDNKKDLIDFYSERSQSSIANLFSNLGGKVQVVAGAPLRKELLSEANLVSFSNLNEKGFFEYNNLINYSLFKVAPDTLKKNIYNEEKWLVNLKGKYNSSTNHALKELEYVAKNKITPLEGSVKFKFYHSYITHAPVILGENCEDIEKVPSTLKSRSAAGKCALSLITTILEQLKSYGVFDNTMIIISADHGGGYVPKNFTPQYAPQYGGSAATLLIKPLNYHGEFKIEEYPAQLSDITKTIASAFNIPNNYTGVDLLGANKPTNRLRIFNYYHWSSEYHDWSKPRVPPITKFLINGHLNNLESWSEYQETSAIACTQNINFHNQEDAILYYNTGLGALEPWGRWSDGKLVRTRFKTAPDCNSNAVKFKLIAFVPPQNPQQKAQVFINDQPAGEIQITAGEPQPREFIFKLPASTDNEYTVAFAIENPVSPKSLGISADPRELGLGFVSMELVTEEVAP